MDGYELAAGLLALPQPPQLVAVTGYGTSADQSRTQASGFALHLVKPIDLDHLFEYLAGFDGHAARRS
jgi:CheY-like chemotaxis protein